MDHFSYRNGELMCELVSARAIADAAGTPCYVYSKATLVDHYDRLAAAFAPLSPLLCFSIKSCGNISLCRVLGERGAGMDLVSGGELHRAILAGVSPKQCVYAGVGKSDDEIQRAIGAGVGWFNVESEAEFENISRIAASMHATCRAALRINPDVDPQTHRYTSTGKRETKFGVDIERAKAFFSVYGRDEHCSLRGLHLHIGSPVLSPQPYVEAVNKTLALMDDLESAGFRVEMLDLGGGFGASYETNQSPMASEYASHVVPLLVDRVRDGLKIILEPGRHVVANAGVLLLRVLYMKRSGDKTFAICDGGMNVLLRPSHYGSFHFIWPARVQPDHMPKRRAEKIDLPGLSAVDVVGPICESGDFLAVDRPLPPLERGDVLAVFTAGAYGMTMANRYNSMPLPAEVMVDKASVTLVRRREDYDDLTEHEMKPAPLHIRSTRSEPPRVNVPMAVEHQAQ